MDKRKILAYVLIVLATADFAYLIFMSPTFLQSFNELHLFGSAPKGSSAYKVGYNAGYVAVVFIKPLLHVMFIGLCLLYGLESRVKEEYNEEHKP
jgi:hypothetical protein